MIPRIKSLFGLLAILASSAHAEPTAEVLHWWTSGGEAKALKVIADRFTADGGRWIDNPVAGGGGDAARTVVKTRLLGGKPPTVMQWHLGLSLAQLAGKGLLADVEEVARADDWDAVLPPLIATNAKFNGKYVAIPVAIHGENWLWTNPQVLAAAGVEAPVSWEAFNTAAPKIRQAGYIPLAVGGQGWQQVIIFSDVVLGLGGAEFWRRALVDLDESALAGPKMVEVFSQLARIREMVDPGASNRDWNETARLVITGAAAMQLMGDWAKGEFAAAGLAPEHDFDCALAPGAQSAYVIAADAFAVPRIADAAQRQGQLLMARVAMAPEVQREFSFAKGSIPPRQDVAPATFDACSQKAIAIVRHGTELLPAVGSNMAINAAQAGAITDAVALFFSRNLTPEAGVTALRRMVDGAR
jgi:glucose/mannose transport system substrate-binding protein